MGLIYSGLTDQGRVRDNNQDSICLNPELNLFIIADGMGGHKGGKAASEMAVNCINNFVAENITQEPISLSNASILEANRIIKKESDKNPDLKGMGTTVVQLFFKDSKLYIGNLGDSRAYLVHKGELFQLSKDHSLVQEKINVGIYTREQAIKDPNKNVLAKTCGFKDQVEADVFTYKVKKNDLFFICSDGLSGLVSDKSILELISKNIPSPENATKEILEKTISDLIAMANANGGNDNISVIVVIAQ